MQIRRSFHFCASHIVRNCTSRRCATSIHGHNYQVEVFLQAHKLDKAGMALDFGIFKNEIASFIDAFDHAHHFWDKEAEGFKNFITSTSARYVKLSFNPSAEHYALMFHLFISAILEATELHNNEAVGVCSVRVHETSYGYAQSETEDLSNPALMGAISLESVVFSPAILKDMPNPKLLEQLLNYHKAKKNSPCAPKKPFASPKPLAQI
ncbi:6-pyruvoyl trahydropterin synthase family protein [Helicobacter ailurogastricus]|uniref:6-carboxy-5,6,7,8-tetrahydropterin synthase n=1 Tax=Helicobacter ailurogastricus TaxID=1578720 RepID=A0A0K2Y1J5_9HELI|nr:6-pyruvoyl tetrahydropterin synthase family protein [Helicobacter ailurogastricus]BDQ29339.1 6-carboxy-5,6,7,8-tetrahydropterin synthase [Helicobacter ailurogastricus]CRF52217.1 Queuosine biosynthesis QueD, PTPS-I [Helicobacter ailurogastricus]